MAIAITAEPTAVAATERVRRARSWTCASRSCAVLMAEGTVPRVRVMDTPAAAAPLPATTDHAADTEAGAWEHPVVVDGPMAAVEAAVVPMAEAVADIPEAEAAVTRVAVAADTPVGAEAMAAAAITKSCVEVGKSK